MAQPQDWSSIEGMAEASSQRDGWFEAYTQLFSQMCLGNAERQDVKRRLRRLEREVQSGGIQYVHRVSTLNLSQVRQSSIEALEKAEKYIDDPVALRGALASLAITMRRARLEARNAGEQKRHFAFGLIHDALIFSVRDPSPEMVATLRVCISSAATVHLSSEIDLQAIDVALEDAGFASTPAIDFGDSTTRRSV